jgi:flagellar biosynthesis/type III secretory pathway chaperone
MTWNIFELSAKIKNLQWLIELRRSLLNMLKRRPQDRALRHTGSYWNGKERVP